MNNKRLLEAIGNIDEKFIKESEPVMKKKVLPLWKKIGALAACIAVVFAVGTGIFANAGRSFTFPDGQKMMFYKANLSDAQLTDRVLPEGSKTRELTKEETEKIFKNLDVNCTATYKSGTGEIIHIDVSTVDESQNHIRYMNVAKKGYPLSDVVIENGNEKTSEIDGVPVTAGYTFVGNLGNRGILSNRVIYYAKFEISGYEVMIEHGGDRRDGEVIRTDIAQTVQYLIKNADFDFNVQP